MPQRLSRVMKDGYGKEIEHTERNESAGDADDVLRNVRAESVQKGDAAENESALCVVARKGAGNARNGEENKQHNGVNDVPCRAVEPVVAELGERVAAVESAVPMRPENFADKDGEMV